jgi:hypothetical protein
MGIDLNNNYRFVPATAMAIRAKSTVAISWSHYHHGRQTELRLVRIRNETFGYTFLQGRVHGQYRQFCREDDDAHHAGDGSCPHYYYYCCCRRPFVQMIGRLYKNVTTIDWIGPLERFLLHYLSREVLRT